MASGTIKAIGGIITDEVNFNDPLTINGNSSSDGYLSITIDPGVYIITATGTIQSSSQSSRSYGALGIDVGGAVLGKIQCMSENYYDQRSMVCTRAVALSSVTTVKAKFSVLVAQAMQIVGNASLEAVKIG